MIVIGVMGGNGAAYAHDFDLARAIGREIVNRGCILLTGGHPMLPLNEDSVKRSAITGAFSAIRASAVIGLLPNTIPVTGTGIDKTFIEGGKYFLYLQSRSPSDNRNILTGSVPDVIIVADGGDGTLSEAAFALHAGRPVVFLNTQSALQGRLQPLTNAVNRILALNSPAITV